MMSVMVRMAVLRSALLASALFVAGCQDTLDGVQKAEQPLPSDVVNTMKAQGMTKSSPILVRIFKEEGKLEVWKQKDTGRYGLVKNYDICKWSGKLGPKFTEGDRQAPEGFYTVTPGLMNPNSKYYLSFNIGYPNAFDRAHGRTGAHLMVHGACSSAGCYSMSDEQAGEIFAFARDAFRGGQRDFQIEAFPFRMTPENMARYRKDPNYDFWKMLKVGYDYFELTKLPPKVDVCEKRYVFNQVSEDGKDFSPAGQCPKMSQPELLTSAYTSYEKQYTDAFEKAVSNAGYPPPKPSIAGLKEANLVADWSRRRARGERVSPEPPSLTVATISEPQSIPGAGSTKFQSEGTLTLVPADASPEAESVTSSIPVPAEKPKAADTTAADGGVGGLLRRINPFGG
jgi:murein L,D-transpeptidase YafK